MLLGCIADDFTGASDLANTLAKGGMATTLLGGVPRSGAASGCEAGVVALKTRSISPGDAVRQSLDALRWLTQQGCRQFFFKYCSTFDSTPEGNIGPVAEALLDTIGAPVAVVCPAFPGAGRTLYQGHLFVRDRLLSESGMEHHPLTPMTDPDIRRWLARQSRGGVGLVAHGVVGQGPDAIASALDGEAAAGRRLAVVDAITDDDLRAIGRAAAAHKLLTGGSGLAIGLADNFRAAGLLGGRARPFVGLSGPGVVLSGSCSVASRAQLAHHLASHPGLPVAPDDVLAGRLTPADALRFALDHAGEAPAIHSTADPAAVQAAQERHGRERVADAVEGFFGALARRLAENGFTRFAVGGGETSGAVVEALGLARMDVGPEVDPGVPLLAGEALGEPLRLALKSGNFGTPDFYDKALRMMEAS